MTVLKIDSSSSTSSSNDTTSSAESSSDEEIAQPKIKKAGESFSKITKSNELIKPKKPKETSPKVTGATNKLPEIAKKRKNSIQKNVEKRNYDHCLIIIDYNL